MASVTRSLTATELPGPLGDLLVHAQRRSDSEWRDDRVGHRCKLDEPHPVGVDVHQIACDALRQACLTNTTRADQCQQAAAIQEATGLGERGFASDKACQGRGQVAAACLASANRNVFVVGRRVGMERFVRCGVGCLPCARFGWREVLPLTLEIVSTIGAVDA